MSDVSFKEKGIGDSIQILWFPGRCLGFVALHCLLFKCGSGSGLYGMIETMRIEKIFFLLRSTGCGKTNESERSIATRSDGQSEESRYD